MSTSTYPEDAVAKVSRASLDRVESLNFQTSCQVWHYHQLHHDADAAVADALFVMGSNDVRVAERAADIYLNGNVTWLIFSGGLGYLTKVVQFDTTASSSS
jgi:hypothetical protein